MTRINCVPVTELTTKHLVAEYRELPRVFALARPDAAIPPYYTLGKGHVTFFYNKLQWLSNRFYELVAEMQRRGYKPNYLNPPICPYNELYNNWNVTQEAIKINRNRIMERLKNAKQT